MSNLRGSASNKDINGMASRDICILRNNTELEDISYPKKLMYCMPPGRGDDVKLENELINTENSIISDKASLTENVKGDNSVKGHKVYDLQSVLDKCEEIMAQAVMNRTTSIDSGIDCTHITICEDNDSSSLAIVRAPLASPEPDIHSQNEKPEEVHVSTAAVVVENKTECDPQINKIECDPQINKLIIRQKNKLDNVTSSQSTTFIPRIDTNEKPIDFVNIETCKEIITEKVQKQPGTIFSKLKKPKKSKIKYSVKDDCKTEKKNKNEITEIKFSSNVFGKLRLSKRKKSKSSQKEDLKPGIGDFRDTQMKMDTNGTRDPQSFSDEKPATETGDGCERIESLSDSIFIADNSSDSLNRKSESKSLASAAYRLHSPHKLVKPAAKPAVKQKESLFRQAISRAFLTRSQSKLPSNDQSAVKSLKKSKVSKSASMLDTSSSMAQWDCITDSNSDDSVDSDEQDFNNDSSSDEEERRTSPRSKLRKSRRAISLRDSRYNSKSSSEDSGEEESGSFFHSDKKHRASKNQGQMSNRVGDKLTLRNSFSKLDTKKKLSSISVTWDNETDSESNSSELEYSPEPQTRFSQKRHNTGHPSPRSLHHNDITWDCPDSYMSDDESDLGEYDPRSPIKKKSRNVFNENSAFRPYKRRGDTKVSASQRPRSSLDDSNILLDQVGVGCDSDSSLEESPNILSQYTVTPHAPNDLLIENSDSWYPSNRFNLTRSQSMSPSPCLKRSQSVRDRKPDRSLLRPYLLPVDDIDSHTYSQRSSPEGRTDLGQGRIYSIIDRDCHDLSKRSKSVSFRNDSSCSEKTYVPNSLEREISSRTSCDGDSNSAMSESELCDRILSLYVESGDDISESDSDNHQILPTDEPLPQLIPRSVNQRNTNVDPSSLSEAYSTAQFVPAAAQKTQARMRHIPSSEEPSGNDQELQMTSVKAGQRSILKEGRSKPKIQRRESFPKVKTAKCHRNDPEGSNNPCALKMSSEELDRMTRLHTFFNGQRQVKYLNHHEASRLAKDFPPPKTASKINWCDDLVDVSCRDYTPRNTPTKPQPILQKSSDFVYPYTDDVPSPILITRLRRSKSSRRYREWPW
ncbi:hypothetical protein ScPMuIL_015264 [Solemya velum]